MYEALPGEVRCDHSVGVVKVHPHSVIFRYGHPRSNNESPEAAESLDIEKAFDSSRGGVDPDPDPLYYVQVVYYSVQ